MSNRRRQIIDKFNSHELPGQQLGDARGSRDTVVDHKFAVGATVNFEGRHPLCGATEARQLSLELPWISARQTGRR